MYTALCTICPSFLSGETNWLPWGPAPPEPCPASAPTLSRSTRRYLRPWGAADSLPQSANSRDRLYTRWRTFWCLLWQSFNPKASGREVVRQLQALFELHEG